jgi:ribose 5-phosphate isomerase B
MKLVIASDHAGYLLKEELKKYLEAKGHTLLDLGTHSEESTDYPDYAHPAAEAVEKGEVDSGVIICGTGNGINIAANKHQGVRAALCWIPEIASLARQHNNANICTLPARFISSEEAKTIVDAFFSAEFEGGRHERRVKKIACS